MDVVISVIAALLLLGLVVFWLWKWTEKDRQPKKPYDAHGWTLVIDGSNVSYRRNKARLSYMDEVLRLLTGQFQGAELLIYCDASLRHQFKGEERSRFEDLLKKDPRYMQAPKGRKADDFLLHYARENPRSIVVSHDWFSKGPELEMRLGVPLLRISFRDDPPEIAEKIICFENPDDKERPTLYEVAHYLDHHL